MAQHLTAAFTATVFLGLAGPAFAGEIGFVRWPDYLDPWITGAAIVFGLAFAWLKVTLPLGVSVVEFPVAERSRGTRLAAFLARLTFVVLMGLIFVGMGLQRAAE